jgi:hypothetical protein
VRGFMLDVAGLSVILALVCMCCGVVVLVFVTVLGFCVVILISFTYALYSYDTRVFCGVTVRLFTFYVQVMFHLLA